MQVDLSLVATISTGLIGGYVALLRHLFFQKEQEFERRMKEASDDITKNHTDQVTSLSKIEAEHSIGIARLDERMTAEEKSGIRQNGEIALLKQQHQQVMEDLEEIKSTMVTRVEFQVQMGSIEKSLAQISRDMRARGIPPTRSVSSEYPGVEKKDPTSR